MSTSVKAVARGLFAAAALIAIVLTPTATGVSQVGGMRASGGALRSSGGLGARRGLGVPGASAAMPGVRVRATAGGVTVRSEPSEGALMPPVSFIVRPLAPGTVIFPFTGPFFPFTGPFFPFATGFFAGSVVSPIIPGTVVNPLFPGTIFVPLFPITAFPAVITNSVFVPVFPTTIISPVVQGATFVRISPAAIGFSFAPSIVAPLTPGIVPPLVPQFIVFRVQPALVSGPEHEEENGESASGVTANQVQVRAAGARVAPAARASTALMPAAPRGQASEARALQEWVRTQNVGVPPARPVWGTSAQPVPSSARSSDTSSTKSGSGPAAIESAFGRPAHRVAFVPRTAFFDDFFATSDGRMGFKQFRHHPVVTADVYYPGYASDPSWFAFHRPGEYPSVYALWGWTPPWVSSNRVSVTPPDGLGGPSHRDSLASVGDADVAAVLKSISGIRSAWLAGDPRRLAPYLSSEQDIGVYFNGKYEYSTPARDFYAMTVDAMGATRTAALELDTPMLLSTGDVVVTGRDGFRDPDGNLRTVYVSYRLRKVGTGWYIADFASSLEPIRVESVAFAS